MVRGASVTSSFPGGLATIALVALLAWIWLLTMRGGFWRADRRLPAAAPPAGPRLAICAIIPARDEAATVAAAARSLLDQDYPGPLTVVVVDDGSSDGTAAAAREAAAGDARLEVFPGAALPDGWTGKLWAMAQGVDYAGHVAPDARWLLLTDADIAHDPHNLRRLVAKGEAEGLDLVSLMVRLVCDSAWERLLIPAFVFFFQKLYPFRWVDDRARRTAAAAGGCMLVRRDALARIGGIASIRGSVIDDCALAAAIKRSGGAVWLGLTETTRSLRGYRDLAGIWDMVARSAYVQLRHSPLLLAGTLAGMAVLYLAPPTATLAGLVAGDPLTAVSGAAGWVLMALAWGPTLALYGLGRWRGALLPVAGLLYGAMTLDSAWRSWRGRGAGWKGRHYAPAPGKGE
ncbi:MAG: glycosyltransferase [Alphaproteobacteria bacterium]|nr:glycosyltransferase [Alphaproteobacteria bacterium]